MENTLENKAKFFALYYGQEVLTRDDGFHKFWKLGSEVSVESALSSHGYDYKYYLELKPLSSISDEDAEYCIGRVECHLRKNDPKHGDYGMSPSGIFVNSIIGDTSYHIGIREADYLRSKGYALPWMGLSVEQLINYGWIKLKK